MNQKNYIEEENHVDTPIQTSINTLRRVATDLEDFLNSYTGTPEELTMYLNKLMFILRNYINWDMIKSHVGDLSMETELHPYIFYIKIIIMYIFILFQFFVEKDDDPTQIDKYLGLRKNPDLLFIENFDNSLDQFYNKTTNQDDYRDTQYALKELLSNLKSLLQIIERYP